MMGGCLCLNRMVPHPASKYPGKRYNILVPDIFPIKPPRVDEDLKPAVIKKIEKLGEYVANNPQRASKVSRRLYRRVWKEVWKKQPSLGYIKIAVHAYTYLLAQKVVNLNLYALELLKRENPLIEVLLKHQNVHLRTLSAELLAHFLRHQDDSDNLTALHALVPTLSWNCRRDTPKELENVEDTIVLELKVACLRGLREHVGMMHRLSADPKHLDIIMASILDNLDCIAGAEEDTDFSPKDNVIPAPPKPSSPVQLLRNMSTRRQLDRHKSTSIDFKFFQRYEIPEEFAHASTPSLVASQVISEFGSLTKAAGNAEKVLQCLLHQLDERNKWSDVSTVCTLFDMMRDAYSRQHQHFLLFTVLLRHAAGPSCLPISERTSLIQLAINEGLMQDVHLTVSVLVHCLTHLPSRMPSPMLENDGCMGLPVDNGCLHPFSTSVFGKKPFWVPCCPEETSSQGDLIDENSPDEMLRSTILDGLRQISARSEDVVQLIDTLLGVIGRFNLPLTDGDWTSSEEIPVLECVVASAEAIFSFPKEEWELPPRKYEQTLQELCVIHCNVSTRARALVNQLIQFVLELAPKDKHTLSQTAAGRILSVMFHSVADPTASPINFAAISHTCEMVLEGSERSCFLLAVQLVHTLWGAALSQEPMSHLGKLSSTLRCAVLILCRSIFASLSAEFDLDINTEQWSPGLEAAIHPSLTLEGSHLLASTTTFPSSLDVQCQLVIDNAMNCPIEKTLKENKITQQQLGLGSGSAATLQFAPDGVSEIKSGSKSLPLSIRTSAHSSLSQGETENCPAQQKRSPPVAGRSASGKGRAYSSIDVAEIMQRKAPVDTGYSSPSICTLDEVLELVDKKIDLSGYTSEEGLDFKQLSLGIDRITF